MSDKKQVIWAVLPAAGSGTRMESDTPKQYLSIAGKTILAISIEKFLQMDELAGVVVVLGKDDSNWSSLPYDNHPKVHQVLGGATRSESVLHALQYLSHLDEYNDEQVDMWVMVHDAARPCVRVQSVRQLISYCCDHHRGAILASPIADTVKKIQFKEDENQDRSIEKTLNREYLWQAHTPQMFLVRELKPALDYCLLDGLHVTDEASAIENVHGEADVVMDRRDNIKITHPEDLALAEFILQQQGNL